jgi:hypothetical protein
MQLMVSRLPSGSPEPAPPPEPGAAAPWLLLIHQIPPKPNYFRVKIWRRLGRLGAVAIKNSVYVLPRSDQAYEDLNWVLQEIVAGGGEAFLCEARFLEGVEDDQVRELFQNARDADYSALADEAREVVDGLPAGELPADRRASLDGDITRLKRHLAEIAAIDFFDAPGRETAAGLIGSLEDRLRGPRAARTTGSLPGRDGYRGRTWVTRTGIEVDRIASAWLIRRFIDPGGHLKYVPAKGYRPEPGELRFDMYQGEFTHEGEDCSFEVLLRRLGPDDAALRAIAEIIHDIDVKDGKFSRPEAAGVERMLSAIAMAHAGDTDRLDRGSALLDDLYELYRKSPT